MTQLNIFDSDNEFHLQDKKIRLITLFSGYDAQALALKYLGVEFEHYKTCEWAIPSIKALYDLHFNDVNHRQESLIPFEDLCNFYAQKISKDYSNPLTYEQICKLGQKELEEIDFCVRNSNNLLNICYIHGSDLEIVDKDTYNYILTYSFPCQDLSLSGGKKGMSEDSGTRSSLVWEVGRILDELSEDDTLPQVLLMKNVPQVLEKQNVNDFAKWISKLESLGYKNYEKILNAKDYGIPQNRARCYMVSILGDYPYYFPEPLNKKVQLKDVLEGEVNEKYYLSQKALHGALNTNYWKATLGQRLPRDEDGTMHTLQARDYKDAHLVAFDRFTGEYYDPILDKDNLIGIWGNFHRHNWEKRNKDKNPLLQINNDRRQGYRIYDIDGICNCLTSDGGGQGGGLFLIPYGTYFTWPDKKGHINTQCNRACNPENISLTIPTEPLTKVVVNSNNKVLVETAKKIDPNSKDVQYLDCYNRKVKDTARTITTRIDASNEDYIYTNYRIRKLTPMECFRLMGVKDEDYHKIAVRQTEKALYHMAGDSIVVNVLMEIFKELL